MAVILLCPPAMTCHLNKDEVLDRARAAFLGMAIGDALGATVEFLTAPEIAARYKVHCEIIGGGWLRLKPGQITDDTEMALCIARAIEKRGGWSRQAIAEEFAAWLKSRPIDCGDTCRKGIRNFMMHGILETPYNQWDGGNGAAMRMLPPALFTLGDDRLLARCALEQARITHNQILSDAACICLGRMLHLALQGLSKTRLRREADALVAEHHQFAFEIYRGLASGYVVDTLTTVFHHFFKGRDFEECLVTTVNRGGDADTTGAICGMLSGAYYGSAALPTRWVKKLNKRLVADLEYHARELTLRSCAFYGN